MEASRAMPAALLELLAVTGGCSCLRRGARQTRSLSARRPHIPNRPNAGIIIGKCERAHYRSFACGYGKAMISILTELAENGSQ